MCRCPNPMMPDWKEQQAKENRDRSGYVPGFRPMLDQQSGELTYGMSTGAGLGLTLDGGLVYAPEPPEYEPQLLHENRPFQFAPRWAQ